MRVAHFLDILTSIFTHGTFNMKKKNGRVSQDFHLLNDKTQQKFPLYHQNMKHKQPLKIFLETTLQSIAKE